MITLTVITFGGSAGIGQLNEHKGKFTMVQLELDTVCKELEELEFQLWGSRQREMCSREALMQAKWNGDERCQQRIRGYLVLEENFRCQVQAKIDDLSRIQDDNPNQISRFLVSPENEYDIHTQIYDTPDIHFTSILEKSGGQDFITVGDGIGGTLENFGVVPQENFRVMGLQADMRGEISSITFITQFEKHHSTTHNDFEGPKIENQSNTIYVSVDRADAGNGITGIKLVGVTYCGLQSLSRMVPVKLSSQSMPNSSGQNKVIERTDADFDTKCEDFRVRRIQLFDPGGIDCKILGIGCFSQGFWPWFSLGQWTNVEAGMEHGPLVEYFPCLSKE